MGDDFGGARSDALVFLPVIAPDRAEVELDVLDRHLRHVRDEYASERVRERWLGLLQEDLHGVVFPFENPDVHLDPPAAPASLRFCPVVRGRGGFLAPSDSAAPPGDAPRMAARAPGPGEWDRFPPGARTRTWIESMPFSFAASATRSAAFIAAYGDASSFAALTTMPPVAFVIVSAPVRSVSVMMMLLYDA